MKIFSVLFNIKDEKSADQTADEQQEKLSRLGREQFKKLVDQGLGVPVALL